MTDAVDPEWVSMEIAGRGLKLDESSSFVLIAVKDDLSNGLVVLIVIHQGSEELVDHSSFHSMSLARDCALLKMLDTSLDEIGAAFPLELIVGRLEELDCAAGMIENLLALWSHRPDLYVCIFIGPVRSR